MVAVQTAQAGNGCVVVYRFPFGRSRVLPYDRRHETNYL